MRAYNFQRIQTNGITLRAVVEGQGPLCILVHGWPELWYSWRHQIDPLVAAGYRVVVPDVRGYGGSDRPDTIEAYDMASVTGDIVGLIDAFDAKQAVLIGHDWGAPIVWTTSVLHPTRVRAVAGLSVPYLGRPPMPVTHIWRNVYKDRFFYQLYFQTPGVAEAELEADVRTALRKVYFSASGEASTENDVFLRNKPADAKLLDGLVDPNPLPPWLTEEELDYYTTEFERTGFFGPLCRYRNFERDWEMLPELAERKVEQPALFIAGERDPVLRFVRGVDMTALMDSWYTDLRGKKIIAGAGHWIQQERPKEVNDALLSFLSGLD